MIFGHGEGWSLTTIYFKTQESWEALRTFLQQSAFFYDVESPELIAAETEPQSDADTGFALTASVANDEVSIERAYVERHELPASLEELTDLRRAVLRALLRKKVMEVVAVYVDNPVTASKTTDALVGALQGLLP